MPAAFKKQIEEHYGTEFYITSLEGRGHLPRPRKPPSQTWRTFLTNHMEQMASIDFFVVLAATFRLLFVFVVLSNARRRVLHFQVTEHPSQEWTMQQMREAFPGERLIGSIRQRMFRPHHRVE